MKDEKEKGPKDSFILLPSSFIPGFRVIDGTRTRDIQDHNLALYQLSYDHRRKPIFDRKPAGVNRPLQTGRRPW